MRQFPASPITALIDGKPRYCLGESMACDLTVAGLLGPGGLASLAEVNLGYGTSAGDPALRALLAARLRPETGAFCCMQLDLPGRSQRRARGRGEVTGPGTPSAHKGKELTDHDT
jgi:hypothetical protein